MKAPEILTTGAGGGLGRQIVFNSRWLVPDAKLPMGDINGNALIATAKSVGVNIDELIPGNLFASDSDSQAETLKRAQTADVIFWNAAENCDKLPLDQAILSSTAQIDTLIRLIAALKERPENKRQLLVVINSIVTVFQQVAKTHGNVRQVLEATAAQTVVEYGKMKEKHAEALNEALEELKKLGIDLCLIFPSAIKTTLTNDPEKSRKNNNAIGRRVKPGEFAGLAQNINVLTGRTSLQQEKLLETTDVAEALVEQSKIWLNGGSVPQEWLIVNKEDLKIQAA
ncbi:MAG: hypothetical protein HOO67_00800 [Candidatus Peribacteraceae bacterium]|nr:hypothetical protein [Candidatus Peribacteraceae bacterium]